MNDNIIISRDQCPRCKANGKDNSKDNLAIYNDGHQYCYACTLYVPPRLEKRLETITTITESNKAPKTIELPFDASVNLPAEVISRLLAWGLKLVDITKHKFMWSVNHRTLILPVYDVYGQLLMYQERSWDIGQRKYLTFGNNSDILHILYPLGDRDNSVIILTEDLVSAIRVSEYKPSMPLWGNDIPLKTIRRLASQFYVVGVWLDPDMKLKAVKDVLRISQYLPCFFIDSAMDPKFYAIDRIKEHIDISGYHMFYKDKPSIVTDMNSKLKENT